MDDKRKDGESFVDYVKRFVADYSKKTVEKKIKRKEAHKIIAAGFFCFFYGAGLGAFFGAFIPFPFCVLVAIAAFLISFLIAGKIFDDEEI